MQYLVELCAYLPCERAKVASQGFLSKHDLIISKAFIGHVSPLCSHLSLGATAILKVIVQKRLNLIS